MYLPLQGEVKTKMTIASYALLAFTILLSSLSPASSAWPAA
jgi:hypothetical protein